MKYQICLITILFVNSLSAKDLSIENAYIKYSTSSTSIVYLSIYNNSSDDKKLIKISSDIAERVELHTMIKSEYGQKMIFVSEVDLPKKKALHLTPKGYHIMLFGIKNPLILKSSFPFKFSFSDGSEIQTNISVEKDSPLANKENMQSKSEMSSSFRKLNSDLNETKKNDFDQLRSQLDNSVESDQSGREDQHLHEGHDHHKRSDTLAPAGIMNPHIHEKGKWMIDYRYMGMKMWGLQSGTKGLNDLAALYFPNLDPTVQMPSGSLITGSPIATTLPIVSPNAYNYMSVPVNMVMEMNMISLMTSISEKWMIMFMVPSVKNNMTMISSNFDRAPMSSSGIGDVSFTSAYQISKSEDRNLFLGMGISLPTGSIDERDNMPMMGKQKVPYNMMPGVGTYSLLPQISYNGKFNKVSWGVHTQANLRIGKNENNYRFGNRYEGSGWLSYLIFESMSVSVRLAKQKWLNLQGSDATLDPKMDPQNDPYRQGGVRSDILIGVNFLFTKGFLYGARMGFEFGKPFHQNLNGPQLATREIVNIFITYTF